MSVFRRAMVYLGLVDDDYDDYGTYDDPQATMATGPIHTEPAAQPSTPAMQGGRLGRSVVPEPHYEQPASAIRTLPREGSRDDAMGVISVTPQPSGVRP